MCIEIIIEVTLLIGGALIFWYLIRSESRKRKETTPDDGEMPLEGTADEDSSSSSLRPATAIYERPTTIYESPHTIYVDDRLLDTINYGVRSRLSSIEEETSETEYVVNGEAFRLKPTEERYRNVELYMNTARMAEFDGYSQLLNSNDSPLQMYIQTCSSGVIINELAYLSYKNWHTLITVTENTVTCAVCSQEGDARHTIMSTHIENLEKHKPLQRFDLNFVRKIGDFYHCGVCNIIFHPIETESHLSSTDHDNNMLSALNKATDILHDGNLNKPKTDTYHYNAAAINGDEHLYVDGDEDLYVDGDVYDDYGQDLDYDECEDVDDEDFYANAPPPLNLEHSYASMARREKPKPIKINIGGRPMTMSFDAYNMVIRLEGDRYYCMACVQHGHVRETEDHCENELHLYKLNQCTFVEAFREYLVRQVDATYYHCGLCNRTQRIDGMTAHIRTEHTKLSTIDNPRSSTPIDKITLYNDTGMSRNGNDSIFSPENRYVMGLGHEDFMSELKMINSNIFNDIIICAFDVKIRISKLAFNVVYANGDVYYCGLCEIKLNKESIKAHVSATQHCSSLQNIPFLEAFNVNLFRRIRDALHCAVCNELVQLNDDYIKNHASAPKHQFSINRALKITEPSQPSHLIIPSNNNNTTESALSNNVTHDNNIKSNNHSVSKPKSAIKNVKKPTQQKIKNPKKPKKDEKAFKNKFSLLPDQDETFESTSSFDHSLIETRFGNLDYDYSSNNSSFVENTEFVPVKKGRKDTAEEELDISTESISEDTEFDLDENIFVKLGNSYIKITNASYNTLVEIGDGTKFCFICSDVVKELKKHVESRPHMENLQRNLFVDKYKEDLLRQLYLTYHCAICNVLVTSKHLSQHLSWPTHSLQAQNTKTTNKQRKNEIKNNKTKCIVVNTQKENIFGNNVTESKMKIYLNLILNRTEANVTKKNKIVIFESYVLKIAFDAWHGLTDMGKTVKCKVCQFEIDKVDVASHVSSNWHIERLERIDKQYFPALIRSINDSTANCIMCNIELGNNENIINIHVQGKKHKKVSEGIVETSKNATDYEDCDGVPVTL